MPNTITGRDPTLELSGEWQFATDPGDDGEDEAWYDPDATWPAARDVSVPHSWQEAADLRTYTGVGWYRRAFEFDGHDTGERALLSFGAVDYETDVWVNGRHVGENEGGYLPFAVDATDAVEPGRNTVVLRVYDPVDLSEIPHGKQGDPWYTRVSGPWQRVDLVTVPETRVSSVRISPDLSDDTATVAVDVAGGVGDLDVVVTIEREGSAVAEVTVDVTASGASATVAIPDADYWTPDEPALYDYEVALLDGDDLVDSVDGYFGMRTVSVEDGEVLLNGEPFAMRGALDQAYYPDTFYRPTDLETFEREIRTAKELGFNLLRKHIKPPHPEFVELADRLGMCVWEEPANPIRYTDASKQRLRDQLRGMIERDYNSPSVIVWSLYNEEWGIGAAEGDDLLWDDPEKQDYVESLYYETREWDPTRLVCDNSGWAHVATDLNDYHEYFVVPDRLDAWRERLDDIVANPAENYGDPRIDPDRTPLVVSEFGTWGLPTVSRLYDHYDGEPHWFDHDFLGGLKHPAGVDERFDESPASSVFDTLDDLAAAWQRREFESIETIIADMRRHAGVSGYVITEFTDIEWEFNGILDYLREEKAFHDDFARVNAPVLVHLDLDDHVARSGDRVTADLVVVNDTAIPVETTVTCECPGAKVDTEVAVSVDPHGSLRIENAIEFDAPAPSGLREYEVSASSADLDLSVSRPVYVASREPVADDLAVYAESDRLRDALAERGYETVERTGDADVALVTDPDNVDGPALVVPDEGGNVVETDRFDVEHLPKHESWNLCACFLYQDLLPEVDPVPGWAFEGIYPYGYVEGVGDEDEVAVGYAEGWLRNEGAVVSTRGDIGVCTLRVTDSYGEHPVATAITDRLIQKLGGHEL